MVRFRLTERNIIICTAALVVLSGLVQRLSFPVGRTFYYVIFAAYLLFRLLTILATREQGWPGTKGYRFLVFIVMLITIILNIAGWQEADFFLLFLLMVDYLLVINRKKV